MNISIKDLVTFTEEILNGKLQFLCSGYDSLGGIVKIKSKIGIISSI